MSREEIGRSLVEVFATVPAPRSRHGRRYPLAAILALATVVMLCGARSLYAIWQWGRLQQPATLAVLGFKRAKAPAVSTLHQVFKGLDVTAFATAFAAWGQENLGADAEIIASAGTAPRVGCRNQASRREPGAALYGRRRLCQQVLTSAGDYLFIVKGNQRTLYEDIALLFAQPPPGEGFPYAEQQERRWGRLVEQICRRCDLRIGRQPGAHRVSTPGDGGLS